jgi:hypothetical protein
MILYNRLRRDVKDITFEVVENLFHTDKMKRITENRLAYQKDIRIAQISSRMNIAGNIVNFDDEKVNNLLQVWKNRKINTFIVFSGNWGSVLKKYRDYICREVVKVCIHMDCDIAPSWKNFNMDCDAAFWIVGNNEHIIDSYIALEDICPTPFNQRENRLVMHGGGWGIGLENGIINTICEKGFNLDVISLRNIDMLNGKIRCFYTNDWQPWGIEEKVFPPLYYNSCNMNLKNIHYINELVKSSIGIISKPGGGTLMDSFNTATPIIFTTAIAKHEEANADYWCKNGFGLTFSEWQRNNFSIEILEECHKNLYKNRINTENIYYKIKDYLKLDSNV